MTLAAGLWSAIQGEAWDDLLTPATAVPIRGQSGDPGVEAEGTLVFDSTSAEQISLVFQMPHAWVHGSGVRFHVHWGKTSDASGDVQWEEKHRIVRNGAVPGAWTDWAAATTRSQAIASTQHTIIDGWAEITMTGCIGSDLLQVLMRRNPAASKDNYGADARLFYADLHVRRYGLGSEQEYPS